MIKYKNFLYLTTYIILFLLAVAIWYFFLNLFILNNFGNNQTVLELLWVSGKIIIWLIPVFLFLKFVDSVKPLEYLKLESNLKVSMKWGFLIGLAWILISLLLEYFLLDRRINLNIGVYYWIGGITVGFFEEIPFRGFLLPKIEKYTPFWTANIITTIIFLLYHLPKWIYLKSGLMAMSFNVASVFCWSLLFGYIYKRAKSLWPSVFLHSIVDLLKFTGIGI